MGEVDENDEELSEEDITPKRSQVDMLLGYGFQPQSLSAPVVQTSQQTTGDDASVTGISDSWNTLLSLTYGLYRVRHRSRYLFSLTNSTNSG